MKSFFLPSILIVGLISITLACKTKEGVVYYVSPTEPLSSCPGNTSCPPGQLCHTMDYLVEHSSKFFSSDRINVTLIFMCGVHNYTKDLTVQNLHSFIMKGAAESKENVIIDHQFGAQLGKPNCTIIQFFNVSFVNITILTMRCPSINLKDGLITVKSSSLYGYTDTKESLSLITITGRGSQALLDNCTFKENCFVSSNFSAGITIRNSTFQSYKHEYRSMIAAYSSVVTLAGYVNFTNGITGINRPIFSSGTAVFLRTTHPEFNSLLNITTGATVYFVNLTSRYGGEAVYVEDGVISIGVKAKVVFMHNVAARRGGAVSVVNGVISIGVKAKVVFMHNVAAYGGGAVFLKTGTITVGIESNVVFAYNLVHFYDGGAIYISDGALNIGTNASVRFSHNSAGWYGGAVRLWNGQMIINTNANLNFSNNSALGNIGEVQPNNGGGAVFLINSTIHVNPCAITFHGNRGTLGGAMYFRYGTMYIKSNTSVMFITNTAQVQGGAIYIESGAPSSIIVHNFAYLHFFNNSAFQGGALYVIPSSFAIQVEYQSNVQFINNTAFDVGGAVYSEMQSAAPCLFMVTDDSAELSFIGNYAHRSVGHHMYGTSVRYEKCDHEHTQYANKQGKPYCWHQAESTHKHINISFHPGLKEALKLSPVSSAPWRVCLCDSNGKPQCANFSQIFTNISVYRGETFTLPAYVVGYDFGTTVGIVHAGFLYSNQSSQLEKSQYNQPVDTSKMCTTLKYTVYSKHGKELLQLQTSVLPVSASINKESTKSAITRYKKLISTCIADYTSHDNGCIQSALLTTPVFINVTLLPGCPPGLTLNHDGTTCSCYSVLANNGFNCSIQNKTGFLNWNSTVWVNATFNESQSTGIIYNRYCPLNYCKSGNKTVNNVIGDDPSKQCASNRTGILCGACMENFSLAIGSSRCIECPNSHNVALLLAFAAAGVFLVFFILALNLTVTQGLINGLIFYANIVWAYKIILFPSEIQENHWFGFLQAFVAWLNLDFGIESCFFVGLDAYWKTWLQFLFPFYTWAIAGVIIVACRYSSRLTNLIGSRAVPLLATLFLLSYMKLLRTIIDATSIAVIAHYPQNTSYVVWYLDGNLRYCQHPHIYLFLAAMATLVFLWLPYTLLLLFIQPLRKVSHLRPLKWINKLAPVYDAYFSSLNDKHQYWFGTMLLVRGIPLIVLTVTSASNPELNVFILFLSIAFLFFFVSVKHVYKRMTVRVLESATLLNLIILSAGTLYKWESTQSNMILLEASLGFAFAQFCVIVVWNLIKPRFSAGWRCRQKQTDDVTGENSDDDITHERIEDPELKPLITHARRHCDEPKATY